MWLQIYRLQAEARSHLVEQFAWPIADKQKVSDYTLKYYSLDSSIRTSTYNQQLVIFEKNLIQFQIELWSLLNAKQKSYFKNKIQKLKIDLLKI